MEGNATSLKKKEQKPLTTEETELNSIAFLEQMGYTCIPPRKEQKPAEKQDYSGLNDFERAILRGFLSAGVENVTGTTIKETAKECLAQMKPAEWSDTKELVFKDICKHLKEEGYNGWVVLLEALHSGEFKQPVAEWNEEDEKIYKMLSSMIHGTFVVETQETQDKLLSWLKSLRSRPKSSDNWKPIEWDEEDREIAQNIMVFLKEPATAELCPQLRKECQDWLKSLPERFNLQPKEEWSEEDKQYFDDLIVGFEKSLKINRCYFTSYDVDWLKSKFNGNSCK
jgi:hypothetical protein